MEEIQWYGYKHINGSLHVKRYSDERDLKEARESDFVDSVYGPWACNRDEAQEHLRKAVVA